MIIYTETYPPFNYANDDGDIDGEATKIVRRVMDETGYPYEIRLVPWARGVLFAKSQKNALLYSMTRTPERETSYDWLVKVGQADFHIFKRSTDQRKVTFEAIQAGEFVAACVSGDLACDLFRRIGVPEDKLIVISNNQTGDFRMVLAERADLYISQSGVNLIWRKEEGYDPASMVSALDLGSEAGLYLVSGWQVSKEVRAKIRAAAIKVKQEP